MTVPTLAQVDQERAALRDLLDTQPQFAAVMREASPWNHGAQLAIVDCLVFRKDPERMLARMWAWESLLSEADK